ncbi:sugar phosphate nucleotidyltransferase [Pseudohoeflea coraliihabitans]|nr:sugar phosphate nucleotidyltransferase [Pseudohoeflea sp. DP4N28-3]
MAGGKGTRLGPYTAVLPKPLVPIGDMPVIELLLRQLQAAGVDEVVLAVNHLHHLIRAFCGDGRKFGLKISYSLEDKPLGTAGPIASVLDQLGERFIVTNGDLLTSFDVAAMVREHVREGGAASVAVAEREFPIDFGLVEADADMRLMAYREKPSYRHLVSMGLYVLESHAVAPHLVEGRYLDMPQLLRTLLADGKKVHCTKQDCQWLDIGRPEDYAVAQSMFEERRQLFLSA